MKCDGSSGKLRRGENRKIELKYNTFHLVVEANEPTVCDDANFDFVESEMEWVENFRNCSNLNRIVPSPFLQKDSPELQ